MQQVTPYMALGTQLAVTVLLLGAVGWYIDNQLNTAPWWLIGGLCVGSGIGFTQFLRSVQRLLEADKRRKQGKENGWARRDPS